MKPPRIIRIDGSEQEYQPGNGKTFTLDEMYAALRMPGNPDPMAQVVPLASKGELLICEENGLSLGLPRNDAATVYTAVDVYQDPGMGVVGNVLICPPDMID